MKPELSNESEASTRTAPTDSSSDLAEHSHSRRGRLAVRREAHALTFLDTIFWLALATGAVYRVVRYLDNRSLWLDEAFLALNLLDKSARDLLGTLDYAQSAPPLFVLVEKANIALLGDSERALRLFPLLSSLVALAVFAWVARRIMDPWAAALALALFSLNDYVVYQASELKPYSTDVMVAVVLLALYVQFERGAPTVARALPLIAAGSLAPLFSFPSPLILAGVGCAVLVACATGATRRTLVVVAGLMMVWLAVFAFVLVVTASSVQQITAQVFPGETSAGESVARVAQLTWSVFVNPGDFTNGTNALAALLSIFGFLAIARRSPLSRTIALSLPAVLAILAAALNKYPIGGRYSLFLVPLIVVFVVTGLESLARGSRQPRLVASALVVIALAPPFVEGARHTLNPPSGQDVRPLLTTVAANWRPGDVLYIYRNTQYAFAYYRWCKDCWPATLERPWPVARASSPSAAARFAPAIVSTSPDVVIGTLDIGVDPVKADLAALPEHGRLWLVFSHVSHWYGLNEEDLMNRELGARGTLLQLRRSGTATLYEYELGAG